MPFHCRHVYATKILACSQSRCCKSQGHVHDPHAMEKRVWCGSAGSVCLSRARCHDIFVSSGVPQDGQNGQLPHTCILISPISPSSSISPLLTEQRASECQGLTVWMLELCKRRQCMTAFDLCQAGSTHLHSAFRSSQHQEDL